MSTSELLLLTLVQAVLVNEFNRDREKNLLGVSEDDDDDEDFGGGAKKAETDDPAEKAKQMAEAQLNQAKAMAQDKCSIQ